MSDKPKYYSFKDIVGQMPIGGGCLSIGTPEEPIEISFVYNDKDGHKYLVQAKGTRRKIEDSHDKS